MSRVEGLSNIKNPLISQICSHRVQIDPEFMNPDDAKVAGLL